MKNYKIENGNLIITIPLMSKRSNPYDDEYEEDMPNIIGLYEKDFNNWLAYRIDMSYKGKDDQCSDYFFKLNWTLQEFEEMCKELKIDYIEE